MTQKLSGYRELTQQEIDLINKIKATGSVLESIVDEVHDHLNNQVGDAFDSDIVLEPFRWAEMGTQNLQTGLMFLTRSVAQPTNF